MTLQRAESVASSGVASSYHEIALQSGLGADPEQDDLLQAPTLEAGIFGVLFTLSQEKNQLHIPYHWIFFKTLLNAWQLFVTIVTPEYGWDINPNSTWWKCVSVLQFKWIKGLGYTFYAALLYSLAGVLAVNLALCVWVAWSFREQKFDHVWPIKVLRAFSYVFLQVFDITTMSFLELGISCNYMGPTEPHLHMALFPTYSCSSTPHVINAVVSGLLLLFFVAITMLFNMSEVDVNPASKSPRALGHSGAEVTAFVIKALLTLVGVFVGQPTAASALYLVLSVWLAWEYLRWVPHIVPVLNYLKAGWAVSMVCVAALQLAVALLPHSASRLLTLVMAMSLAPACVLGALATWFRTKLFLKVVTKRFRTTDPEAIKPQDVYHFVHPRDVEVAARCARQWTDLYTLEKTAVHRAEEIIKAGIALFPDDAFVSLVYANFMLDMLGFSQTGARQLESVRKLNPSIMCRFMLFVRQQQATQKAASSTVGKGGNMDLLGYVEYQRKQRTVMRHHKDALQAMANFWRILGNSTISFTSLSKSLEEIDNSVSKAETAYRVAMDLYNNSPRLVRLYARFLETIKQDPWTAAQYYATAERLEENKDFSGQGPSLPDGTPMSRMDDVEKGILVVNAFGDIQVANRKLHDMFGYKKGDLDSKNVTLLMPPHEAKRHPAILRRYIDSGDQAPPYFRHPVLGIHRERVALTVRIEVSRASGLGEDSVFIGILEIVPTESGLGRVWVTPEGIIVCCDPGFVTCFGYHPEDVIGMHLDKLLRSSVKHLEGGVDLNAADVWAANQANHDKHELVHRMLASAAEGSDVQMSLDDDATVCRVLHKYDFAKACRVVVKRDLTDSSILEVRMKLESDEPQLLMVVERKGAIRHMSGDLAKVLGVRAGMDADRAGGGGGPGGPGGNALNNDHQVMLELMVEAPPCSLDDFLPSPWKAIHYKYRKYLTAGGSAALSNAWGCRAVLDDCSNSAGPTMYLMGMHGKPVYVHVAVSSREEEGEIMHVVRMARSSLETAVAERRVRMQVSLDGLVQQLDHGGELAAPEDSTALFGFPLEELVGCRVWEFLSMVMMRSNTSRESAAIDLLDEAEAFVAGSHDKMGGGPREELVNAPLDYNTFDSMVTSSLQTPGISWRVNIVSPATAAEAAALGNPARMAAVLAKRTKHAVLKLDVTLPPPSAMHAPPGKLQVHAELWAADAVTGVLEVNASGRVAGILEEEVRPPGLLFGLPKEGVVGSQLGTMLRLGPGQSAAGLLTESGIAKKSSLKASSRKGKTAVKVGPVHYLEGFHRDGQRLSLAVQVVGKPGPGNPVIAVVRMAPEKRVLPPRDLTNLPGAMTGGPPGAGGPAPRAHVSLDLGNRAIATAPSQPGGFQFKLRGATSMSRAASMARDPDLMAVEAMLKTGDSKMDLSNVANGAAGGSQTAPLLPTVSAASLNPVAMPRIAAPPGAEEAGPPLPGASALAAGVANLLNARSAPNRVGRSSTAAAAATDGAAAVNSSPEKPESPSNAGADKPNRPSAARKDSKDSGQPDSAEGPEATDGQQLTLPPPGAEGAKGDGGDTGYGNRAELKMETLSLAAGEAGSEEGLDDAATSGVNKWVATGGKFYKNRAPSVDMSRADGDFDDEDDDGAGSFGGMSRATSSHWAQDSPKGSINGDGQDGRDSHLHQRRPGDVPLGVGGAWDANRHLKGGDNHDHHHHHHHHGAMPPGDNPKGGAMDVASVDNGQLDDRGDSDGESDISGMSGGSGDSDDVNPADYKRGKRYRKLVKLMNSPQAKKAMLRLKFNTGLAVMAAIAIHVVSFALIITGIRRQSEAMDEMEAAGGGQRYLQRALVSVRALDQSYKGKGSNDTYGPTNAETFANDLLYYSNLYRDVVKNLLEKNGANIERMFYTEKVQVWSGYNASTRLPYSEDITIWDLVTRVYVSAKSVFQNHVQWHQQGVNISSTLPAQFLLNSGQALSPGFRQILDALLDAALTWTDVVTNLQLAFLLVEGGLVTFCAGIGLMLMLKSAFGQRYQLYETFLSIPIGLTRALAAQTTHMLDDDESDDGDDEEEGASQVKDHLEDPSAHGGNANGAASPGVKRKTLFEESPTAHEHAAGRGPGGPHPTNGKDAKLHDLPVRHGSIHQYAMRNNNSRHFRLHDQSSNTAGYSMHSVSADGPSGKKGFWSWLLSKFRRGGSVHPMQSPVPFGADPAAPRRTLNRNSKVAKGMLSIVLLYSVLVVLFYGIDYFILLRVRDQVALQAVADYTSERTYRSVFYAQELGAEEDASMIQSRMQDVRNATIALRDAYYTIRTGAQAATVLGSDVERFPAVEGPGLIKGSATMFSLFYSNNVCLRLQDHLPCPPPSYRFYEVTRAGMDGMMIQMLAELKLLVEEAAAAAAAGTPQPGLGSERWDYIYNVGTQDLNDACLRVNAQHISDVNSILQVVVIMHVVLFLLLMGVFLCFLLLGYLPLMHRMDKEKRRIAEMMSQLPAELDVMRMFSTALMGPKHGHSHHFSTDNILLRPTPAAPVVSRIESPPPRAATPVITPPQEAVPPATVVTVPGNGGTPPSGDANGSTDSGNKGYQAWKDILNRVSANGGSSNAAGVHVPNYSTTRPRGKV